MESVMPKVSIITISYNSAATIEQTIQSVLSQSYTNIEYIIIDGGSTDGTIDIIQKYEKQITYWISESDKGISDAFNKGLKIATGEIIGILNSDDFYHKSTVLLVVDAFLGNDTIGFVFGNMDFVDSLGRYVFTQLGDANYLKSINYTMPAIAHPTVFVKKTVYLDVGFFATHLRTAMDYEFLLRVSIMGKRGYYLDSTLATMRLNGESDENYINGYKEVCSISIYYGYPVILALARFTFKTIKTFIRRGLEKANFNIAVRKIRGITNRSCYYKC